MTLQKAKRFQILRDGGREEGARSRAPELQRATPSYSAAALRFSKAMAASLE